MLIGEVRYHLSLKNFNKTFRHSKKEDPHRSFQEKKMKKKTVHRNLQDKRKILKLKLKYWRISTANFRRTFSKSDLTNCGFNLYTSTEITHDTVPSQRINLLSERY